MYNIEKDWELKPTKLEIEMHRVCSDYEYTEDGVEQVANRYNINLEEAIGNINKVNNLIYK